MQNHYQRLAPSDRPKIFGMTASVAWRGKEHDALPKLRLQIEKLERDTDCRVHEVLLHSSELESYSHKASEVLPDHSWATLKLLSCCLESHTLPERLGDTVHLPFVMGPPLIRAHSQKSCIRGYLGRKSSRVGTSTEKIRHSALCVRGFRG
jgi:hypothetical protein